MLKTNHLRISSTFLTVFSTVSSVTFSNVKFSGVTLTFMNQFDVISTPCQYTGYMRNDVIDLL